MAKDARKEHFGTFSTPFSRAAASKPAKFAAPNHVHAPDSCILGQIMTAGDASGVGAKINVALRWRRLPQMSLKRHGGTFDVPTRTWNKDLRRDRDQSKAQPATRACWYTRSYDDEPFALFEMSQKNVNSILLWEWRRWERRASGTLTLRRPAPGRPTSLVAGRCKSKAARRPAKCRRSRAARSSGRCPSGLVRRCESLLPKCA